MFEVPVSGSYRPLCLTLWNDPEPHVIELYQGDLVVSVRNLWLWDEELGKKRWGWRYLILRPVGEGPQE